MREQTIKLYQYDELTDTAKEKALQHFEDINVDLDWWDYIYEDAKNVGLKINGFVAYRYCDIEFIESAEHTAHKIVDEHGEQCATYQTAKNYLSEVEEIHKRNPDDEDNTTMAAYDEAEADFQRALSKDYLIILCKEYEYLTSEEGIAATIQANEYEFTEDGKIYN